MTTVIDCLRHGEVEGGRYFRGSRDDALTETGWQQMRAQADLGEWQFVVSSPLHRCRDFAEELSRRLALPLLIEPGWAEIDFGDWEGLTATQIESHSPGAVQQFYADPAGFTPPKAEPYRRFAERIELTWESMMTELVGQRVLLVTHAGVIRALYAQLLGLSVRNSLQIDVPYACMTRFSCFQDATGRFVQLNFHRPLG